MSTPVNAVPPLLCDVAPAVAETGDVAEAWMSTTW